MSIELLSMLQIADSFFPSGTYTMSNGLEALFKRRKLKAQELGRLIETYMEQQLGPADVGALGNANECAKVGDLGRIIEIDGRVFSMKLVEEVRSALARSGSQMIRCACAFVPESKILTDYGDAITDGRASGINPVALAVVCAALGIEKVQAGEIMLYSFCVGMVGAALRLGTTDHLEAQKILHGLKPAITRVVQQNIDRSVNELWQFAPSIDAWQMAHERLDSKMFIT